MSTETVVPYRAAIPLSVSPLRTRYVAGTIAGVGVALGAGVGLRTTDVGFGVGAGVACAGVGLAAGRRVGVALGAGER